MDGERVRLTSARETYLATLHGKALDCRADDTILGDTFADEAVRRIDFDFESLKPSIPTQTEEVAGTTRDPGRRSRPPGSRSVAACPRRAWRCRRASARHARARRSCRTHAANATGGSYAHVDAHRSRGEPRTPRSPEGGVGKRGDP
jgi:hypothetical protein